MVTSLLRVGQSVLMRAREGEGEVAAKHRIARLSLGWNILVVRVSQVDSGVRGSGVSIVFI